MPLPRGLPTSKSSRDQCRFEFSSSAGFCEAIFGGKCEEVRWCFSQNLNLNLRTGRVKHAFFLFLFFIKRRRFILPKHAFHKVSTHFVGSGEWRALAPHLVSLSQNLTTLVAATAAPHGSNHGECFDLVCELRVLCWVIRDWNSLVAHSFISSSFQFVLSGC